jgi:hypothetical protein
MAATDTATETWAAPLAARGPNRLLRWWRRRRIMKLEIAHAVWDLRERYGDAAYGIAQNSALQIVGFERRRFWRQVAAEISRRSER